MTDVWNVWAVRGSQYMMNVRQVGIHAEDVQGLDQSEINERLIRSGDILKRLQVGELIDEAEIEWAWCKGETPTKKNAPSLSCFGGAYSVVNEETKNLLSSFNLGETRFFPINVMDEARLGHPWPEQLYLMNVGNIKNTAVTPHAAPFLPAFWEPREPDEEGLVRFPIANPAHIEMSEAALEGPDIWIEKHLEFGLFVSKTLAIALKNAGLASSWGLRKTKTPEYFSNIDALPCPFEQDDLEVSTFTRELVQDIHLEFFQGNFWKAQKAISERSSSPVDDVKIAEWTREIFNPSIPECLDRLEILSHRWVSERQENVAAAFYRSEEQQSGCYLGMSIHHRESGPVIIAYDLGFNVKAVLKYVK